MRDFETAMLGIDASDFVQDVQSELERNNVSIDDALRDAIIFVSTVVAEGMLRQYHQGVHEGK